MIHISDAQRRARLLGRHALSDPAGSVEDAVGAVVCLHATEPASVFLSAAVRSGAGRDEIKRALYADRTVVKQLAMRRTLFAFPRELLPAVWGSASRRVATAQRTRLAKDVVEAGIADDGAAWLEEVCRSVLTSLAEAGPATTTELRRLVPALDARLGGWQGATSPIAGRVLTVLGAEAAIVRGDNELGWRRARQRWHLTGDWLHLQHMAWHTDDGYRELVRRWLARFGPGTETDLTWWLGSTKSAVRRALQDLAAVEVRLDSGATGWVLPDDLEPDPEPPPTATLLPVLDPTLMGWKERGFYLDPADVPYLFDTNGNGGTTAWWNGHVVGCWVQHDEGVVRVVLRRDPGVEARDALTRRAERLSAWLAGEVVNSVYASPQMRGERLP